MDIKQLYKECILEHNRHPRNFGTPSNYTHKAEGLNAICGDQVFVYLTITDEIITDIHFDGESCAISTASASMMTEFIKGKTRQQALSLFADFCLLMDRKKNIDAIESLAGINALAGVKSFPSRIKSATLCWHALNAALLGKETASTE